MAVTRSPHQKYLSSVEKFKKMNMNLDRAIETVKEELLDDLNEFTSGASPSGKARIKWLRQMGHPYARGKAPKQSQPLGRKRGGGYKGAAPRLPIGQITGRLRRAKFVTRRKNQAKYIITAGFNRGAKGSIWSVLPNGTKKMVSRDLWGPKEKGALGQRVKAYRKALRETFLKENKKP
jgi:hypothetical protein